MNYLLDNIILTFYTPIFKYFENILNFQNVIYTNQNTSCDGLMESVHIGNIISRISFIDNIMFGLRRLFKHIGYSI